MANGTWKTTAEEDAAILALGIDATPDAFVQRHLRHQFDFALSQAQERLRNRYDTLSAEDKAAVDAILQKQQAPK